MWYACIRLIQKMETFVAESFFVPKNHDGH